MGGLAKGHLIRELDALGGEIGRMTDRTTLFRHTLNRSRGPAVRGTRAQVDRPLYRTLMQEVVLNQDRLEVIEGRVCGFLTDNGRCVGVELADGQRLTSEAVILTTGTFLGAICHRGDVETPGGRHGETEVDDGSISAQLRQLGLRLQRLKTGTCPRIHRDSIDYSQLDPQYNESDTPPFSDAGVQGPSKTVNRWGVRTNPKLHDVVRENLHRAPMYSGSIEAEETHVTAQALRTKSLASVSATATACGSSQGLESPQMYLGGLSTSLPQNVQAEMLKRLPGFERAEVLVWGYAVAYDAVDPIQLDRHLMVRQLPWALLGGTDQRHLGLRRGGGAGFLGGAERMAPHER